MIIVWQFYPQDPSIPFLSFRKPVARITLYKDPTRAKRYPSFRCGELAVVCVNIIIQNTDLRQNVGDGDSHFAFSTGLTSGSVQAPFSYYIVEMPVCLL